MAALLAQGFCPPCQTTGAAVTSSNPPDLRPEASPLEDGGVCAQGTSPENPVVPSGPRFASSLPKLYLLGVPGKVGGASTKILHLVKLLSHGFQITVVLPSV